MKFNERGHRTTANLVISFLKRQICKLNQLDSSLSLHAFATGSQWPQEHELDDLPGVSPMIGPVPFDPS